MKGNQIKKWGMHPVSLGVLVGVMVGGTYLIFNNTMEEEINGTPVNAAQATENNWQEQDNISPKKSQSVAFHFDDAQGSNVNPDEANAQDKQTITQDGPPVNEKPLSDANMHNFIEHQEGIAAAEKTAETAIQPQTTAVTPHSESAPIVQKTELKVEKPKAVIKETPKTVETKDKTSAAGTYSKEEERLLGFNKNHYTLQLLGARKPESVKAFIQKHALNEKAYSFKTQRAGKDWYVVVYGEYPSAKDAKAAIDGIPETLKKDNLQPWVRELNGVHEDIRAHRQG